jgi:hypothetical protein
VEESSPGDVDGVGHSPPERGGQDYEQGDSKEIRVYRSLSRRQLPPSRRCTWPFRVWSSWALLGMAALGMWAARSEGGVREPALKH